MAVFPDGVKATTVVVGVALILVFTVSLFSFVIENVKLDNLVGFICAT